MKIRLINTLNIHSSTVPIEIHARVLRELANVFVRPLLIISAIKLWQMGGIPEERSKVYVCYLQERQRKGCED